MNDYWYNKRCNYCGAPATSVKKILIKSYIDDDGKHAKKYLDISLCYDDDCYGKFLSFSGFRDDKFKVSKR